MSDADDAPRLGRLWIRNGIVWAALMALLTLTIVCAYLPLGPFNTPIGVVIAFAKAGLVVAFFMGLAKPSPLPRLAALAGVVWLFVMFALTFADVLWRARPY